MIYVLLSRVQLCGLFRMFVFHLNALFECVRAGTYTLRICAFHLLTHSIVNVVRLCSAEKQKIWHLYEEQFGLWRVV